MKKVLSTIAAMAMLVSMAACGNDSSSNSDSGSSGKKGG